MRWIVLLLPLLARGKLWNISTDPLPPLQPAECGYQVLDKQLYLNAEGEVVLQIDVAGYFFNSYSRKFIQSTATGTNFGKPVMQLSFTNYTSQEGLQVSYDTQTCNTNPIEGLSPYQGYDFYQEELINLYNLGVPVQFEYVTKPEWGVCLQYSAVVPWNNPSLPRNILYTSLFQNSTGYLVSYSLVGTEYCCFGANFYCPNSGNCSDGSAPQLTYATTNQTQYDYQIFSADSWPKGFFSQLCPFSTSSSASTSSDDDNVKEQYFIGLIVVSAVLGLVLLVGIFLLFIHPRVFAKRTDDRVNLV